MPLRGATYTWAGGGTGGGDGSTVWDTGTNWNPTANFTNGSSFDFSTITGPTTLSASKAETIAVQNIEFGDATSSSPGANVTLNGDGTAGDVVINLQSSSGGTIYTGLPGALDTVGSDLTINFGTGVGNHLFSLGSYFTNTAATGVLSGTSVLVLNSALTGSFTSGVGGTIILGVSHAYDSGNSSTPAVVVTNNANNFDGPITFDGFLGYTSISSIGGGASALGSPSTGANGTINFGGSQPLAYIGAGNQNSNLNLNFGTQNVNIANDATSPSTLTLSGTITDAATSSRTMYFSASSGNTLIIAGSIPDGTSAKVAIDKDSTAAANLYYYDTGGVVHTANDTGTLMLTGSNTYSNGTTVNAGTLQLGDGMSGSIAGAVSVGASGTFAMDEANGATPANAITDNGVVEGIEPQGNTVTMSGAITGGGLFVQSGSGTTVLSNNNTYAGTTTVSAGTLLSSNGSGSATGTNDVIVGGQGAFGGQGIIAPSGSNNISVAQGGAIVAGGISGNPYGILQLSGTQTGLLSAASGAAFEFTLGASDTSSQIDFTNYKTGELSITGSDTFSFADAQPGQYVLFKFLSGGSLTTLGGGVTAANFDLGDSTGLSGYSAALNFSTTGEIILDVTAVPEPETGAAMLMGCGMLAIIQNRRRRWR
jgi:autotransporter-associated beta strand protein